MPESAIERCRLFERTLELLRERRGDLATISAATQLNYRWLESVLRPSYQDSPSVDKVVKLYEHLSGKTLPIE